MKRCLVFVLLAMVVCVRADIHGVKGGLVVCIGAEAAEQVSNHWKNPQFLFQCLEKDAAKVSTLRKKIQAADLYGQVSVSHWNEDFLPYNNDVVNLVVGSGASKTEMARVLVPYGVAVVGGKKSFQRKFKKKRPNRKPTKAPPKPK